MAYIRCAGDSGGSIQKKTATGAVATFNTGLPAPLIDVTSAIGYRSNGYTSATVINSKTTPVFDLVPYLTRANTNTGNLALEKLVGLTVCFNQLVNTGDTSINTVSGHKYYTSINGTKSIIQGGSAVSINDSSEDNIIDLTAMFGTEVADYLYTLESGTAGTGVTLFKSLFGEEYYPYTANTLMSCKPLAKVIVGKNLFGGAYDTMFRLPFVVKKGTVISASAVKIGEGMPNVRYYDENQTQIDFWGLATTGSAIEGRVFRNFTLQADIYYVKFDTVEVTDMQFEIGAINTAFEPYSATTVNFSGTELRGILKVGTNGLYADGDTDDGSGTGAVRYGIVDLGSLDWTYYEYGLISGGYSTSLSTQLKQETGGDTLYNAISVLTQYTDDTFETSPDLTFAINYYGYVKVHVSGVTDSASLKSALSGKYLIYELATPTTQTISAWTNPIVAKEGGTETIIDGNEFSIVDLGSLEWTKGGTQFNTNSLASLIKIPSSIQTPVLIADNMIPKSSNDVSGITGTYEAYIDANGYLYWFYPLDDFADGNEFKTAMQGHYLIYENTNSVGFQMFTGHDTIYGTDLSVKKAEFGTTVFGGSVDFTTGEVISNKNADGTDKTAETISVTPVEVLSNAGTNNVLSDTNGNTTAQYIDKR